jgi:hypothetical protein
LPNILPIVPGLIGLVGDLLPSGTKPVETTPPKPVNPTLPTEPVARIDLPYWGYPIRFPPGRYRYPPIEPRVPPFGPPPVYVMPPVWTGTPYRPWPPYGGVPLPPIPPDSWGQTPWWLIGQFFGESRLDTKKIEPPTPPKKPWYEVLPFKPGDPRPDMPSIQPVYDSAPPPPPPPPPKQEPQPPPPSPTWYWDYQREGIQRE